VWISGQRTSMKSRALDFGRSFQLLYKSAALYSIEHEVVQQQVQRAYAALTTVLQATQELTFGFAEGRVLINNVLTTENSLAPLQSEFSKRGIAAICFGSGISLLQFKKAIELFSVSPKTLVAAGGIIAYAKQHPLEHVRIIAAQTPADADKDIVLGHDAGLSFAAGLGLQRGSRGSIDLELLLDMAGLQGESGLSRIDQLPPVMGSAVQGSLASVSGDPQHVLQALTELISDLGPEQLVGLLSTHTKREYLPGWTASEIASEFMEDVAATWAVGELATAKTDAAIAIAHKEVIRVLLRSLQATRTADRTLSKLARLLETNGLPDVVMNRIREELTFAMLPLEQQARRLLEIPRYTDFGFRRLIAVVAELRDQGSLATAFKLATHYLKVFDLRNATVAELSRAAEFFRLLPGPSEEVQALHEEVIAAFLRDDFADVGCHQALIQLLVSFAQNSMVQGSFDMVQRIGGLFERAIAENSLRHVGCCAGAMNELFPSEAIERLIDRYLNRDDSGSGRALANLLRSIGPRAAEVLVQRLEQEPQAGSRLRLVRLIGQIGGAAFEAVRRRLSDSRWYVVRNACVALGDLGDPQLLVNISPALRHVDERVQLAAFRVVQKVRLAGAARTLAEALPTFATLVLDMALDELLLRKDGECLLALEAFILQSAVSQAVYAAKAVQITELIHTAESVALQGRVLGNTRLAPPVRQRALFALQNSSCDAAKQVLCNFAAQPAGDFLVAECQRLLAAPTGRSGR
jgi:HEAT repeat protein